MNLGISAYRRFQELEESCARLGFRIDSGSDSYSYNSLDYIALLPTKDCLPAYSRDAVLYRGDLEGCLSFLQGWQRHTEYLTAIKLIRNNNVEKAEEKHIQELEAARLMHALRTSRDPGDLRKKSNRAKLEEDDAVPF
jgi:hypothetical protein